jgi:hypothetical protein
VAGPDAGRARARAYPTRGVNGTKTVQFQFEADGPNVKDARAKGWKVGDEVTATCNIGGAMDNYMLLVECKL